VFVLSLRHRVRDYEAWKHAPMWIGEQVEAVSYPH
jgi:hypothetical protein